MALSGSGNRLLACISLFLSIANAQGRWHGASPDIIYGSNGDTISDHFLEMVGGMNARTALIAHAAIASAVWVLLIPAAGILLRLNISSPWVLRVHAALQIFSYIAYIAAAGLGIWLVRQLSFPPFANLWDDPHPCLGLAILALAFFQPIFGAIHHSMFKKRVKNEKLGIVSKAPGRTAAGHVHLWLGRLLIVMGVVNGGLGIRLASRTPFQSSSSVKTAGIIYGVVAAVVAVVYLFFIIRFEITKSRRNQETRTYRNENMAVQEVPPPYTESRNSLQKGPNATAVRYT